MAKRTDKHKAIRSTLTKARNLENAIKLPFNGNIVLDKGFSFSFSCFDRDHKLFNLGGKSEDGTVGGERFIRLLDCLKNVSGKSIDELKKSTHDLHPVKWENANAKRPASSEQAEYWQFRIDKSHGRVIGILIDSVFYIVWLDPYHNLTNSEGYCGTQTFAKPKTK